MTSFTPVGLTISAQITPCANHCRFCLLNERRTHNITVDRFAALIEKFIDYKDRTGFKVKQWFGNSYNFPIVEFQKLVGLFFKNGADLKGAQDLRYLLLGGLPLMEEEAFRSWLLDRQALGCANLAATYCGLELSHDYYCACTGHFRFQIMAQKTAAKIGLFNMQRLLILNSTLQQLEPLLDELDATGGVNDRHAFVLFYNGSGKYFEHERPTLEQLQRQSPRVMDLYRGALNNWKTESDWVAAVLDNPDIRSRRWMTLRLTDKNIDQLEKMSCEEIVADLSEQTRRAYEAIPRPEELAEKYSNKTSQKVYMSSWDVEGLWLDRFQAQNPEAVFNRQLIYAGI